MSKLFSPLDAAGLALAHRLVLPGLVQLHEVESSLPHSPTTPRFDYARRATSNGLLISEPCYVSLAGSADGSHTSLVHPEGCPGWQQVIHAVHANGGMIVAQLCHMGRLAHSSTTGSRPVGPSTRYARCLVRSIHGTWVASEIPEALDQNGIDKVIAQYKSAAISAVSLGFDGVELNGADGYLPNQFLDDVVNDRADRYGGSIGRRTTFIAEVVHALIQACGAARVGVRVSPYSEYNDAQDSAPRALYAAVLQELSDQEIAYVHFVRSDRRGRISGHEPFDDPLAARTFRAAFAGAILVSGEFTKELAIASVESRWADAVGFGTSLINDPDFIRRLLDE
jgi:N-ethylmaleimide reductase